MMDRLRGLWPALPALAIAWFAGASFMEKYPRRPEAARSHAAALRGPDSLLLRFRRELAEDSAADSARDPGNFFRPIRAPRPVAENRPGGMVVPPPPRNFQLNGTVGREVATITNNSGGKRIVRIGDTVDSAQVISIEPNKVVLRDRAGRFELQMGR